MMHGIDFVDACRWLEARYLGGTATTGRAKSGRIRRVMQQPNLEDAAVIGAQTQADPDVFGWILERSPLRPDGAQYLASRGFGRATLAHFRVGQIGNGQDLLHVATAKWSRQRLVACGLLKEARWGDEFVFPSNYLLFPFLVDGNVIYLQARRPDGKRIKRWYCPHSLPPPLFNADALSIAQRTITLCEGVTDVLSAFELDMDAVGLLGASSRLDDQTIAQFRGRNLSVLGDADKAGRGFAKRMSSLFAPHGLTIVRKRLPAGCNDLNDYLIAIRKA
ncbi:toprim domain-containing protein [Sphingobium xenophagum]|nr:toprim domain-containing protein [Sphingobium xenophagum]